MPAASPAAEWLGRLVRTPSVSPDHAGPRAGTPGEARIVTEIAGYFKTLGGEVFLEDVFPNRPNVMAIFPGKSDRWIGVDVHTDTVGVETMDGDPFSGRIADGKVWGRGSSDTKATLGVVLALLEDMKRRGRAPSCNLLVAATADEEYMARGAPALAAWLRRRGIVLDEMIVAEPTLCGPVHGHKGVARWCYHVTGEAAHSSQPHLGRNAVTAAARIVLAMEAEHQRLMQQGSRSPLGSGTLTVTIVRGGEAINIVPPRCEVWIDRRITAGETASAESRRLNQIATNASDLPVTPQLQLEIEAYHQPADTPFVKSLAEWSGLAPAIVPYGTNAWAYPPDVARQCVVLGPGSIDQAHTKDEWVAVSQLDAATRVYSQWLGLEP